MPTGPTPSHAETARAWVLRLASGDVQAEELAALKAWLASDLDHARAFERERSLWQALEPHGDQLAKTLPKARPVALTRRPIVWAGGGALAACLLLGLVGPGVWLQVRADYHTGPEVARTIDLPDGSVLALDSQSAVRIDFDAQGRRIELLEGAVWVEVRHGDRRPFQVVAGGGTTTDIGTAFEVRKSRGDVEVGVTQGAVSVATATARPVTLTQGERVTYTKGRIETVEPTSAADLAAWRSGEILVSDQSLKSAVEAVARYRSAPTFLLAGETQLRVNGVFRTDKADDALAAIAKQSGRQLTRLPGGAIVIR